MREEEDAGRELDVSRELLERLPAELRAWIPVDWLTAVEERSGAAVSWRWAKNPTGDEELLPLSVKRGGWRPGRRRKPPAPEGTELSVYGYDADGRALIAIDRGGNGTESQATLVWRGGRLRERRAPGGLPSRPTRVAGVASRSHRESLGAERRGGLRAAAAR